MSHEIHHFTMGPWVVLLAYLTSAGGAFVGLACAQTAMKHPAKRGRWLVMAALAIGGVAIWLMHFLAMMGFTVSDSAIRYAIAPTVFSAVLAVSATLFGLWFVDTRAKKITRITRLTRTTRLLIGGAVMGLAVSLMHYSGMAAIQVNGTLEYHPVFVITSVLIGITGSTAALWFTGVAERISTRVAAAFAMGTAVTAMHYAGMAGVSVTGGTGAAALTGTPVLSLMFPAYIGGVLVLAIPITALLLTPDTVDEHFDESIQRWTENDDRAVTDPWSDVAAFNRAIRSRPQPTGTSLPVPTKDPSAQP